MQAEHLERAVRKLKVRLERQELNVKETKALITALELTIGKK